MSRPEAVTPRRGGPVPASAVPGIVWPAIPDARHAQTFALLAQLELTQWWPPQVLERWQMQQATRILRHAARTVPYYRDRLSQFAEREAPLTAAEWRAIPILTATEFREAGDALMTTRPLDGHDGVFEARTSGSVGAPICIHWNAVNARFHAAVTLRDHLWHGRDPNGKFGVLKRLADDFENAVMAGKAAIWAPGYRSGPMAFFDLRGSVDDALDWLAREDPDYLSAYPTYLRSMLRRSAETGFRPKTLRQAATVSEVVDEDLRRLCQEVWGVRLVDMYSAQEAGFVALQCPDHEHYLVQSECNLVEVLNDAGEPSGAGETGRVVVTPLHNFTQPLIRYDLGDFARVGAPCASGRGLPVLERILGRARNMMKLPDGSRHWVALSNCGLEKIAAIRQMRLIQKSYRDIELKLVVARPLTQAEVLDVRESVGRAVRRDFDLAIDYVDEIPRTAGGKYEDVICEIAD